MYKTFRFKLAFFICHIACFLLPESVFKYDLGKTLEKQANRFNLYKKWGNLSLREQIIMQAGEDKKRNKRGYKWLN